jgi:hypothetical protein
VAACTHRVVEVEPAHTRLDDGVRAVLVDLEDAVHPAEADYHGALQPRRRAAVAVVHPGRVRPDGDPAFVRDPDDLLDLLDGLGHDDRGCEVVVPGRERERVAELREVALGREHAIGAQRRGESLDGAVEVALRHAWGKKPGPVAYLCHVLTSRELSAT